MLSCCHVVNTSRQQNHKMKLESFSKCLGVRLMIAAYLRIKKNEERFLEAISKELNQQRLDLNKPVLKPSDILHNLIEIAIYNTEVKNGELTIKAK